VFAAVALDSDAGAWSEETTEGMALRAAVTAAVLSALDSPGARAAVVAVTAASARVTFGVAFETLDGKVTGAGGTQVALADYMAQSSAALIAKIQTQTGLVVQSSLEVTDISYIGYVPPTTDTDTSPSTSPSSSSSGSSSSGGGSTKKVTPAAPNAPSSAPSGINVVKVAIIAGSVAAALLLTCCIALIFRKFSGCRAVSIVEKIDEVVVHAFP
jgi:hypothetical protein